MKILQTGDLHLGKIFYDFSLIEDQRHVLAQLLDEICAQSQGGSPYDALLICGDVYDRAIPPAEATQLFSHFLGELREKAPQLAVLLIPGNHDSAARLSFASELLEHQLFYFRTDTSKIAEPVRVKGTDFYLLPFLNPGAVKPQAEAAPKAAKSKRGKKAKGGSSPNGEFDFAREEPAAASAASSAAAAAEASGEKPKALTGQAEMTAEAVRQMLAKRDKKRNAVLVAHLFAAGALASSSEGTVWGAAEQVDSRIFDAFTYSAIGHLHRFQKCGRRAYYAGSPLAYSVDEGATQKCFLRVELADDSPDQEPKVTPVPVKPLRAVASLSGSFDSFYNTSEFDAHRQSYVEISSTDDEIVENPAVLLRPKFPFLLSFTQERAFKNISTSELESRRQAAKADLATQFRNFLGEIYDEGAPDGEELELFAKTMAQAEKEAQDEAR